jgi:2,3-bisphosphoglycerate-independent phosphoglycerate mutase
MRPKPIVLCILDGWGHRAETRDNAIAMAKTPVYARMLAECPHTLVQTSGLAVGLPDGQMGNSEVGHMNIGAGRAVVQDLNRIDAAVLDGTLAQNPELLKLIAAAKAGSGTVHVMGLLSPGGVHSHQDHIAALAKALDVSGLKVWVHGFLDGRDTPPKSALDFVAEFERAIAGSPRAKLGTVGGRYWGMDRDKRWERVQKAYDAIVAAHGEAAPDAKAAVQTGYAADATDEFIAPAVLGGYPGIQDGDAVIMANFRADRARQILTALVDDAFDGFPRARRPKLSAVAGMTEYSDWLTARLLTLFPAEKIEQSLGEILSGQGMKQLRLAETEKYPHVTYFFNGGREAVFPGEDRVMVQSPKVATYDLKPEMSAVEVTDKLLAAIGGGAYDLIVVNYANPDMVGHTGDTAAAIRAVETIDACLGRIWTAVESQGGVILQTADHGNVEMMVDPVTGAPHTAHTTLDVPTVLINAKVLGRPVSLKSGGRLADIAPTILALMGLEQPAAMTGVSLLDDKTRDGAKTERAALAPAQ